MKIISRPSFFVEQILSKQKKQDNINYRKIKFIIKVEVEDGILLFNYLTLQLILLSYEEYKNYENIIIDDKFNFYLENWFYVSNDYDEIKVYYQIREFAKMTNYGMNYRQYTIFPTLDCNARCFYCYEAGKNRDAMNINTANQVSNFIIKNHINTTNQLRWFGGEPLYNTEAIDTICNNLRNNDIPFTSMFISNAYLFNEENIIKAKKNWNTNLVHTTLDGTQDFYNKIKNYIYKEDENPFNTVIGNIHNLLNNDIEVIVRMNFSENNVEDIEALIDFLLDEFENEKKFSMYVNLLQKPSLKGYFSDADKSLEIQADSLIKLSEKIFINGFHKNVIKKDIFSNICKADSDSSYVILPNGNFTRCENFVEENRLGNVFDGESNNELKRIWKEYADVLETCESCPLVPGCISLKNCNHGEDRICRTPEKRIRMKSIEIDIKQTYRKFLEMSNQ